METKWQCANLAQLIAMYRTLKKCIKRWGHLACFCFVRAIVLENHQKILSFSKNYMKQILFASRGLYL